uniref:Uncharacterized protein n=1 Tax=Timema tahoe TaxID=61484 RepID=A0A7R9IH00_9NEOP|nr:unnamed protein product [Timema tahoe]
MLVSQLGLQDLIQIKNIAHNYLFVLEMVLIITIVLDDFPDYLGQLAQLPKFIIIDYLPISVGTRLKRQTHRIWFAGVRVEGRDSEERLHNPWPPPTTHYYEPEEDQSNQIYQPHGSQASRSEYSPRRVTGSLARPRGHPRTTTGLYHTSQWGTARIPYRGAVVKVPVVGESRKREPCSFHLTAPACAGVDGRNYERNTLSCHSDTIQVRLSGAGIPCTTRSFRRDCTSATEASYKGPWNALHGGRSQILFGFSAYENAVKYMLQAHLTCINSCISKGASRKSNPVSMLLQTHKGTVTTTILSRRHASTRYSQGIPGYAVQDASVEDQVCVRCPVDRTVVASRGTDFVFMPHSKLKKCKHRPRVPGAKWEYLYGPRPGSIITEGSHVVAGRALYNHKQLQQCQYRYTVLGMNTFSSCLQYYRYTVLVRKCPPLMLPKYVDAHCSRGNVWGSECELLCQQGYQLHGHNVTVCGDQLMWTNPLPQCSVMMDCPLPMSPSHGRLSCHTPDGSVSSDLLPEGSVCRYMCDEGYSVPESESHLLVTLCTAAEWNSTADPSCQNNTQPQVGQYQRDAVHHTVRVRHRAHTHAVAHSPKVDPCLPNPCQAGGTCLRGPQNRPALCICAENREGEDSND